MYRSITSSLKSSSIVTLCFNKHVISTLASMHSHAYNSYQSQQSSITTSVLSTTNTVQQTPLSSSSNQFIATSLRSFSSAAAAANNNNVVVFVDHDNKQVSSATLSAVTAATQLSNNQPVVALVLGHQCADVAAQVSKVKGVGRVLVVEDARLENPVAEDITLVLSNLHKALKYSYLVTSTSAISKSFIPRLGVELDVQPITDVVGVKSSDTFVRPVYAGNALCTVQTTDSVKLLTVRPTNFDKAPLVDSAAPVEQAAAQQTSADMAKWVSNSLRTSNRPELNSAKIVVSGGRGMKSGENFKMLEELADVLGGAVGASRAAVDAGFVPNDLQVGQTGKVVAPELYIAVGISGAIQHLAGMKDSKKIVAINKDAEAPIFQVADYGLVADLFKAIPELSQKLKASKQA